MSNSNSSAVFGFWVYILSDCILFSAIFAAYAVLHTSVYAGPSIKDITNIPYIFAETIILLTSSFTFGMAMLALYKKKQASVFAFMIATFMLGAVFVGMELNEFIHLYLEGHTWQTSAALSAFFTLVGTHGLHVSLGLVWMLILMVQLALIGMQPVMIKRLTYFGLFWAFLDIVWIFVFTIVYLMGAI
jgi:cytochrome o ubiquinol oxidase subunit 3